MDNAYDILEILNHIDPSILNYQGWVNVGMALKHEGHPVEVWDTWSRNDHRYHAGECEKKWRGFHGAASPVTGGTIVQLAKDQGWIPEPPVGHQLDWDDEIEKDSKIVIDKNWIEEKEIPDPREWNPASELVRYLETLFDSTDYVGYTTKCWKKEEDGKYAPKSGVFNQTAGKLIEELNKYKQDISFVIGDLSFPQAGAWIRFNPLDGKGVKNENVTDFRYALVECDDREITIAKQNAMIRELELPVACLVHSGNKSLHAIVRVDATDCAEYRKRVDYLYNICNKNGLKVDSQNRNPSRLSRMPGIMRGEKKQFLVDTNIGKESWTEWKEWIESVNDDLPDPECLTDVWNCLPELAPPLIDGMLRQGHKLLISGPSKAGKSFALIEMVIAIAEGRSWLGWDCAKGRVLYVNLELDRASCLHRFKDVYTALGWNPNHLNNIDIWNLRGKSKPMDKLAPMLIRRAAKKNYIAIIIDPIYKVITGDENSADQMANFCNQFDKVCTELGVAVIYCHHHSKGSQGGKKSMDRASGSGVFARDPDAILDLIELELTEEIQKRNEDRAVCEGCVQYLEESGYDTEDLPEDDLMSSAQMIKHCEKKLTKAKYDALRARLKAAKQKALAVTAWRIEGTLREFPKFAHKNLWFDYPIHTVDSIGILNDIRPDAEKPSWKRAIEKRKSPESKKEDRKASLNMAYEACSIEDKVTIGDLETYMGVSKNTVKNRIKEHGGFEIEDGIVIKKGCQKTE